MELKLCKLCGIEKPLNEMGVDKKLKSGYESRCKKCRVLKQKPSYYYEVTLPIETKNKKIYNNPKKKYHKYERVEGYDLLSTKEKRKIYLDNYKKTNKLYSIRLSIKRSIYNSLNNKLFEKNKTTIEILGCSIEEFRIYMESKFEDWMNWDNYGLYNGELNYGWDIDHIIPLSSVYTKEETITLNHYTNLQPLCSKVNRYVKKDNIKYSA